MADITDFESLKHAFSTQVQRSGPIDVLVANAGYLPAIKPISESSLDEWYNGFEVNVKGNFYLIRTFMPNAAEDAALLNISTGVVNLPCLQGFSGYATSKLAAAKLFDYVHGEYPNLFVLNIHPGVIDTSMNQKTAEAGVKMPFDDGKWMTSTPWRASAESTD